MNLILNGLDPVKELARHDAFAAQYRAEMTARGRRRTWKWRELLRRVTYHEECAAALRKEVADATRAQWAKIDREDLV